MQTIRLQTIILYKFCITQILFQGKPTSIKLYISANISRCEAIKFNPRVLDLNSKVEDENGIKSAEKIKKILELLRRKFACDEGKFTAFAALPK